jgi:hypothetical protein
LPLPRHRYSRDDTRRAQPRAATRCERSAPRSCDTPPGRNCAQQPRAIAAQRGMMRFDMRRWSIIAIISPLPRRDYFRHYAHFDAMPRLLTLAARRASRAPVDILLLRFIFGFAFDACRFIDSPPFHCRFATP